MFLFHLIMKIGSLLKVFGGTTDWKDNANLLRREGGLNCRFTFRLQRCSAGSRYRRMVALRNASYIRGINVMGPGSLRGTLRWRHPYLRLASNVVLPAGGGARRRYGC